MNRPQWKMIGRGFNGWHADAKNCSSSGGDLLPYTYWTGQECAGYAQEAAEGCPIYDASGIEEKPELAELFIREVISGPMVNTELEDKGPQAYANAEGFDYVSIAEKFRRLRRIPGIKFGLVQHGLPVWEPEPVQPEPVLIEQP